MKCLVLGAWCVVATGFAAVCGCATDYGWRSSVPKEMRTVSVPTFRNESDVAELGAIATRQVLREIQREGTFRVRDAGEAALEIQGVVKSARPGIQGYDRRANMQLASRKLTVNAEVSVIDKRTRKVLIDNRTYTAEAVFTSRQDLTTAERDASGRVAEDLARQVVDDLLTMDFGGESK